MAKTITSRRVIEPTTRRQITISDNPPSRYIDLGDLTSTIKIPWLPTMRGYRDNEDGHTFVSLYTLGKWATALDRQGYKTEAKRLTNLIKWAQTQEL